MEFSVVTVNGTDTETPQCFVITEHRHHRDVLGLKRHGFVYLLLANIKLVIFNLLYNAVTESYAAVL